MKQPNRYSSGNTATPYPERRAKGFAQTFGLDPRVAMLTFIVDNMLFAGEGLTLGMSLPFSLAVGVVVGLLAWRAQIKWYGDDSESAFIKGAMLGLLTAIPTSLPGFVYMSSGAVGLVHVIFRRK